MRPSTAKFFLGQYLGGIGKKKNISQLGALAAENSSNHIYYGMKMQQERNRGQVEKNGCRMQIIYCLQGLHARRQRDVRQGKCS